jgi:hypothetical protein
MVNGASKFCSACAKVSRKSSETRASRKYYNKNKETLNRCARLKRLIKKRNAMLGEID